LVVQRSCGCLPEMVIQAGELTVSTPSAVPIQPQDPAPVVFANQDRDLIVAQIASAGSLDAVGHIPRLDPDWAGQLTDAFLADLDNATPGQFLPLLEGILGRAMAAQLRVIAWQGVLSAMRRAIRPHLRDDARARRAEDLWQQARTLLGDFAVRDQGHRRLLESEQIQVFNSITRTLMTTFDVDGLMDVLAQELPKLDIPACYLFLYEYPDEPTLWARMRLAYDEFGRIPLESGGQRSSSRDLVRPEFLRTSRRRDMVALPLHFQEEQLGFVVMEMGPRDGNVYEALRMQIASALKGALLATRNEELYQEALEARKVAEEADRLKSRFLSTVSHELRTPLSLIVGTIEMQLREDADSGVPLPDRYRLDLHSIRSSAQHLSCLISDVLDLASSQAGQLRLHCERLNMAEVLADVMALGEPMAREKGLSWHVDIPDDLPFVWGDRTRLHQVALNLISNAVKFTHEGTISLWAETGKDELVIAVSDTGVGIPTREHTTIFDEFHQSDRTSSRGFGGMGLGLAVSRRLVESHGGQIGVLSPRTDGAGSTVYFSLPAMAWPGDKDTQAQDRSGTVLVLAEQASEDSPMADHLRGRGYQVELVNVDTTRNWLAQLVVSQPGAVVLDFEPGIDRGWELMQVLRENLPTQDIPVVLYTLSEETDHGAMLELDYLIKPVSAPVLARTLERQGIVIEDAGACTLLVVDDDPGILDLHVRLLEKLAPGCHIIKARDGREALKVMEKTQVDLVLLDLMMPFVNGFEVLQTMRKQEATRQIPVVVLTAQRLTAKDMERLRQGVAAVLTKGLFSTAEMMDQIEAVLCRSKQLGIDAQSAVRKAMAYIHEHYPEPISRADLATRVGLCDRYLTQCFRQETGFTPFKYLNRYRIHQACAILEAGDKNVTEAALAVGFSDPSYFGRVFRDQVGVSPRAYQQGERPPKI
jgi:signal transduction histidine kinase/CheY-like chemotaxis protein